MQPERSGPRTASRTVLVGTAIAFALFATGIVGRPEGEAWTIAYDLVL